MKHVRKLIMMVVSLFVVIALLSCTQLFEPKNPKVSVVLSSGQENGEKGVASFVYQPVDLFGIDFDLLKKSDAPWVKNIEKLEVKITKFSYRYSTGPNETKWATPTNVDKTVDLLALSSSEESWLTFDIPKGAVILAIAFEITQATVTINGTNYPVTIPSASAKIVLKNLNWSINEDGQVILSIDWSKSIIKVSTNYLLVPRVAYRWRGSLKNLWAIQGKISRSDGTPPNEPLLIELYEGETTSSTPMTLKILPVKKAGEFYLGKYKPGKYTIVVWKNLTFTYEDTEISISGTEATKTTFDHGKTSATTILNLKY